MRRKETKNTDYTKSSVIRICKFIHILLTVFMYMCCLYHYNSVHNHMAVGNTRFMIFVALYAAVLCFSLRTYKAYDFGLSDGAMLVYSQSLADLIAGGVFYVVFVIANSTLFTPLPLMVLLGAQVLLNCVWSFLINRLYFKINKPKKTALIYSSEQAIQRISDVYNRKGNFEVIDRIEVSDAGEFSLDLIQDAEAVFISDIPVELRNKILEYCIESGKSCFTAPRVGDIVMMGATHMDMFSVPVFAVSRATMKIEYAFVKRAIDIVCSLIGIIVLSPLMLITAAAVMLYDRGPALYKQVRLTRNGKEFKILKFRSMRVNAESDGVARLASDNDDRITPVGKIIRACRLDELPQLFNILKGDMSIVGPRPERPEIAEQYLDDLPAFNLRLQVRAGLTGLAQVYGRYNTEPYDKLQMDLMYVNEMSFVKDLRLMFATVKILFVKDSTQGAEGGKTAAMAKNSQEKTEREVSVK